MRILSNALILASVALGIARGCSATGHPDGETTENNNFAATASSRVCLTDQTLFDGACRSFSWFQTKFATRGATLETVVAPKAGAATSVILVESSTSPTNYFRRVEVSATKSPYAARSGYAIASMDEHVYSVDGDANPTVTRTQYQRKTLSLSVTGWTSTTFYSGGRRRDCTDTASNCVETIPGSSAATDKCVAAGDSLAAETKAACTSNAFWRETGAIMLTGSAFLIAGPPGAAIAFPTLTQLVSMNRDSCIADGELLAAKQKEACLAEQPATGSGGGSGGPGVGHPDGGIQLPPIDTGIACTGFYQVETYSMNMKGGCCGSVVEYECKGTFDGSGDCLVNLNDCTIYGTDTDCSGDFSASECSQLN